MEQLGPEVSIILPVKNGGAVLLETLRALLQQRIDGRFEVIAIDSASRDGSAEAIERLFADPEGNPQHIPLLLKRIAAREFGHGRTRNMGARLARGGVLVFLSQDATPVGSGWLAELVRPFSDPNVAGAFCRQVARPEASLPERFILETAYPAQSALRTRASLQRRDAGFILFSNAASAVRRAALEQQPFAEDIMMCEDAHWAVDVLEADHTIAYVANAQVLHSHGYSLSAAVARTFDYAVSLKGLPGGMTVKSYGAYLRHAIGYALQQRGAAELPSLLAFEAARCAGYTLGAQYRRLPLWVCRRVSGYPQWFADHHRPGHRRIRGHVSAQAEQR